MEHKEALDRKQRSPKVDKVPGCGQMSEQQEWMDSFRFPSLRHFRSESYNWAVAQQF